MLQIICQFFLQGILSDNGRNSICCRFLLEMKLSSKSSREDMCRLPTSYLLNIQSRVKQETGKTVLHDTVLHTDALCQISESWFCVSREKSDRNFL